MLSLRGGELWLLALRRRLAVDGRSVAELRLRPGQLPASLATRTPAVIASWSPGAVTWTTLLRASTVSPSLDSRASVVVPARVDTIVLW